MLGDVGYMSELRFVILLRDKIEACSRATYGVFSSMPAHSLDTFGVIALRCKGCAEYTIWLRNMLVLLD